MIVRINIRQPYLSQQLKVEFLAENFPFIMSLLGYNCPRFARNTPLRE